MSANYISLLQPAQADGTLSVNIATIDGLSPTDFNVDVDLLKDDSPITCAKKVQAAINDYIKLTTDINTGANYSYIGQPTFSNIAPPSTFRLHRTEHVISLWSQCNFELSVIADEPNTMAYSDMCPILVTLSDVQDVLAQILDLDMEQDDGTEFSILQSQSLMAYASDELCSLLNNYIVATTYLWEGTMNLQKAIEGRVRPGLAWDVPAPKRPWVVGKTALITVQSINAWNWTSKWSKLNYRFANELFDIYEPFDMNNEVKWTYVAGYYKIAPALKKAVGTMITRILEGTTTEEIQLGLYKEKIRDYEEILRDLMWILKKYRL